MSTRPAVSACLRLSDGPCSCERGEPLGVRALDVLPPALQEALPMPTRLTEESASGAQGAGSEEQEAGGMGTEGVGKESDVGDRRYSIAQGASLHRLHSQVQTKKSQVFESRSNPVQKF